MNNNNTDIQVYQSGQNPLLYIGMYLKNEAEYVEECVRSLLSQTFHDFKLLVSDNCSTDNTFEILQRIADEDPRVIVVRHKKPLALNENLDFAFEECKGKAKYFMCAGGHDRWAPSFLESCVSHLEQNPTDVLAYGRTMFIDKDGTWLKEVPDDYTTDQMTKLQRAIYIMCILYSCSVLHGIIRQSALKDIKMMKKPMIGEDHVFLAQLALKGGFYQHPEVFFFRREVRSSETVDEQARRCNRNWQLEEAAMSYDEGRLRMAAAHIETFLSSPDLTPVEAFYLAFKTIEIFESRFNVLSLSNKQFEPELRSLMQQVNITQNFPPPR